MEILTNYLDELIKERAKQNIETRPFICHGIPGINSVFIIGFNPATKLTKNWINYWNIESGFDFINWEKDYKKERIKLGKSEISRTRNNIYKLEKMNNESYFETNIFDISSKEQKDLKIKNETLIAEFIKALKPKILVIHGKESKKEFIKQLGKEKNVKIGEDLVEINNVKYICVYAKHFSRISNNELEKIGNKIRLTTAST